MTVLQIPEKAILADVSVEVLYGIGDRLVQQVLETLKPRQLSREPGIRVSSSITTVRSRCAKLFQTCPRYAAGAAVGALIKAMFPTSVAEHYIRDLSRVFIQNFSISADLDRFENDEEYAAGVKTALGLTRSKATQHASLPSDPSRPVQDAYESEDSDKTMSIPTTPQPARSCLQRFMFDPGLLTPDTESSFKSRQARRTGGVLQDVTALLVDRGSPRPKRLPPNPYQILCESGNKEGLF